MKIKYKKISKEAFIPVKANKSDSGWDVRATERSYLQPHSITKVPIGLAFEIPEGYEIQIRGKSGLALEYGFSIAQGIGTIDSGYRGEVCIILKNLKPYLRVIEIGDMVAQLVIQKVEEVEFEEVDELEDSERGKDGFGKSTEKMIKEDFSVGTI